MEHWIKKIIAILEDNGYSDVEFDYEDGLELYFEGYTDAHMQIKVEMKGTKVAVYDRYVTDKHFVHYGDFSIFKTLKG